MNLQLKGDGMKFRYLIWFVCLTILFGTACASEEVPHVLRLQGTPYKLGYQHGSALKEQVVHNIKRIVDDQIIAHPEHPQIKGFLAQMDSVVAKIPAYYLQEMKGLADGAGVPFQKVLLLNLFPEMFHCVGLTVSRDAGDAFYHVRVLDYAMGNGLQDTAVLLVVSPEGKIPFANLSYAGFIGSVTGMHRQHISVGEIGGKGYGDYNGLPMAFIIRNILEEAASLQDAKKILDSSCRTCEYFYVIADGKTEEALAAYATPGQVQWIEPGKTYALFDGKMLDQRSTSSDKVLKQGWHLCDSDFQTVIYENLEQSTLLGLIHQQPKGCLAITGFSYPERYPLLMDRVMLNYGRIGVEELKEIIRTPVARPGNLHNAIFAPVTLDVWFSHAGKDGEPACDQPYHHMNLKTLLEKR
jgi:hypothetical protein